MGRKKKEESKILTDTELKLMNIIWKLGEATVHEVIEKLEDGTNYAYNTVSTIIRVLEQKEFLESKKNGRSHIYFPKILKSEYETVGVSNMVNGLFDGAPIALIKSLLGSSKLTQDDISELQNLINEKE